MTENRSPSEAKEITRMRQVEEKWRLGGVPATWPEAVEAAREQNAALRDALDEIDRLRGRLATIRERALRQDDSMLLWYLGDDDYGRAHANWPVHQDVERR